MEVVDINRDWHQSHPHSFGGKYRSYWKYNSLTREDIDKEFFKNDIYTKFKPLRRSKYYNPVYVYRYRSLCIDYYFLYCIRKRELWQADVVK